MQMGSASRISQYEFVSRRVSENPAPSTFRCDGKLLVTRINVFAIEVFIISWTVVYTLHLKVH